MNMISPIIIKQWIETKNLIIQKNNGRLTFEMTFPSQVNDKQMKESLHLLNELVVC